MVWWRLVEVSVVIDAEKAAPEGEESHSPSPKVEEQKMNHGPAEVTAPFGESHLS